MPEFVLTTQPDSFFQAALASRLIPISDRNSVKILITLDMGEALKIGSKVRLIVYDLDDYLTGPLGLKETQAAAKVRPLKGSRASLWPFTNQDVGFFDRLIPDTPLPEEFRDPTVEDGVLLKADLLLKGKPAPSGNGWWWWVEELLSRTQVPKADAAGQGLRVKMWKGPRARTGRARLGTVGRARYIKSELKVQDNPLRKLVFRFIALEKVSDFLGPGSVFLCNLKKAQNTVARPLYVETTLLRRKLGFAPPVKPKASTPAHRNLEPDLTGYWEEMPVDPLYVERKGFTPPGFLCLNQAGAGRVGWYSPYSELGFTPFPNDEFNRPFLSQRFVLRVFTKPVAKGSKRFLFQWTVAKKKAEDPTVLIFPANSPAADQLGDALRSGELEILTGTPQPQLLIKLFGKAKEDGSVPEVERYFRKVSARSRLPWFVLRRLFSGPGYKDKAQADAARRAVIAEQAEPIPVSFWIKVGAVVSSDNWALQRAIDLFVDNSSSASQVPRTMALRLVSQGGTDPQGRVHDGIVDIFRDSFWGRPKFAAHHNQQLRAWIQAYAARNTIQATATASGQSTKPKKTVKAWLEDILFWGLDYLVKREVPFKDKPRADVYPGMVREKKNGWQKEFEGFILAGVQTGGVHTYKLQFFALKGGFEPKAGIGFTVGGFTLKVTASKNGKERWNASFTGAFGGISAGLAVKKGKKVDPGGGPAGPPSEVEFESFYAFEPGDFRGAPFKIAAVGFPTVTTPIPGQSLKSESSLFTITLERADGTEIDLSKVIEGFFQHEIEVPDVKDYRKQDPSEFALQLFSVGMTFGYLVFETDRKGTVDPPDEKKPNRKVQADPTESSTIFFKKGSAKIEEEQLTLLDGRLATYRKLIEEPGFIHSLGYVSPEWKGDKSGAKNLKLSQERATSTMNAVFGAVGSPGALGTDRIIYPLKSTKTKGFGEDPATDPAKGGPLLDPENPERYVPKEMTRAEFDARVAREEADYPGWRRVDLLVNGLIVIRLRGN